MKTKVKIKNQAIIKLKKIMKLCENNKIIKNYFDYKMNFIKENFKISVAKLCNEITQNEELIKSYTQTHTKKDSKDYQNFLYQTPKNINEVKGLVLTQSL